MVHALYVSLCPLDGTHFLLAVFELASQAFPPFPVVIVAIRSRGFRIVTRKITNYRHKKKDSRVKKTFLRPGKAFCLPGLVTPWQFGTNFYIPNVRFPFISAVCGRWSRAASGLFGECGCGATCRSAFQEASGRSGPDGNAVPAAVGPGQERAALGQPDFFRNFARIINIIRST